MSRNTNAAAVGRGLAIAVATMAGLAVPGAVLGQQPGSVTVDVGACVNLESPEQRFACYEEQVQRARSPASTPTPAAAAAPNSAAAPAAAAAAAPSSAPAAVAPTPTPKVEADIEGVITALRETVPNAWVITLDSGQVWRQNYAKWYPLAIGKRVKISPRGRFGPSYRLTVVGTNGYIQVEPVR